MTERPPAAAFADHNAGDAGEVDPELMDLAPRRRRNPLISVIVIAFACYLALLVRADVAYFFQPRTPRDLGDVQEALRSPQLRPNRYVTIAGAPDRKRALLIEGRFGGYESFFRMLQSESRLYVQRRRPSGSEARSVPGIHSGRLVAFNSLPYAKQVAAYLRKTTNVAHDFDGSAIIAAKRGGKNDVRDQEAQPVQLAPATVLWINATYPDEWVIQLSKKAYATRKLAEKQLEGMPVPYAAAEGDSPNMWRFVVLANAEQVKQIVGLFGAPERQAGVVRRQVSYTARWDQVDVDGDALVLKADDPTLAPRYRLVAASEGRPAQLVADKTLPVVVQPNAIKYITVSSTFTVPNDAMVLLAGVTPASYWYYLVLAVVLATLIVLNFIALVSWLRRRFGTRSAATYGAASG